jgi:anti-sigma B factor antagonist
MVHADTFTASSVSRGRTRWITLAGEFDLATAPVLRDELENAATHPTHAVVLDLSGLSFMDCAALRAVINFADGARIRGWRLRLVYPPPPVARIVTLTKTGTTFPFALPTPRRQS